jgi:hypothetical protein
MSNPKVALMTDYITTSAASLLRKAEDLDQLALRASRPGHARIYQRVADLNRIAAAFAKISETLDWQDAEARVGRGHVE